MGRRKPTLPVSTQDLIIDAEALKDAQKDERTRRRKAGKKKAKYEAQPDPKGFFPITVKMDLIDLGALDYLVSRMPSTRLSKTRSRAIRDAVHQLALANGYGPSL